MEKIFELTKEQKDIMKEVGTVGVGYATTSLSKMTGKEVKTAVTVADVIAIDKISTMIETVEDTIFSVYTPILGITTGSMMIITPRTSGYILIDMIEGKPLGTTKYLDRIGESALEETQNIMGNSYLTALNDFMGITLLPARPRVASIYKGDIDSLIRSALRRSAAAAAAAGGSENVLIINAEFLVEKVKGVIVFAIALESIEPMLKAIRERIGGRALKKQR